MNNSNSAFTTGQHLRRNFVAIRSGECDVCGGPPIFRCRDTDSLFSVCEFCCQDDKRDDERILPEPPWYYSFIKRNEDNRLLLNRYCDKMDNLEQIIIHRDRSDLAHRIFPTVEEDLFSLSSGDFQPLEEISLTSKLAAVITKCVGMRVDSSSNQKLPSVIFEDEFMAAQTQALESFTEDLSKPDSNTWLGFWLGPPDVKITYHTIEGMAAEVKCVYAHACILAARSDFFKSQLSSSWAHTATEDSCILVNLSPDVNAFHYSFEALQLAIRLMYSNGFKDISNSAQIESDAILDSTSSLLDTWQVAAFLQCPSAMGHVVQTLAAGITHDTVVTLLNVSKSLHEEFADMAFLRRKCYRFLQQNIISFVNSSFSLPVECGLEGISMQVLSDVLSSDSLNVHNELDVLHIVFAWDAAMRHRVGGDDGTKSPITGEKANTTVTASGADMASLKTMLTVAVRFSLVPSTRRNRAILSYVLTSGMDSKEQGLLQRDKWYQDDSLNKEQLRQMRSDFWALNPAVRHLVVSGHDLQLRFENVFADLGCDSGALKYPLNLSVLEATRHSETLLGLLRSKRIELIAKHSQQFRPMDMVCRMFHPSNGRHNFSLLRPHRGEGVMKPPTADPSVGEYMCCSQRNGDSPHLTCDDEASSPSRRIDKGMLPSAEVITAMLLREETLRLDDNTQRAFAIGHPVNPLELILMLQLQTVREFGFSDSCVHILRSAQMLYRPDELPLEKLPHYIRFNRSRKIDLEVQQLAPDVPLHMLRHCAEEDAHCLGHDDPFCEGHPTPSTATRYTVDQVATTLHTILMGATLPATVPTPRPRPSVIAAGSFT